MHKHAQTTARRAYLCFTQRQRSGANLGTDHKFLQTHAITDGLLNRKGKITGKRADITDHQGRIARHKTCRIRGGTRLQRQSARKRGAGNPVDQTRTNRRKREPFRAHVQINASVSKQKCCAQSRIAKPRRNTARANHDGILGSVVRHCEITRQVCPVKTPDRSCARHLDAGWCAATKHIGAAHIAQTARQTVAQPRRRAITQA